MGEYAEYREETDRHVERAKGAAESGQAHVDSTGLILKEALGLLAQEPRREQKVKDCTVSLYKNDAKCQKNPNGGEPLMVFFSLSAHSLSLFSFLQFASSR